MILFLLLWEVCLFDLFSTFKTWLKGQRSQKTSSHFCGVWEGWLEGNLILQIFLKKNSFMDSNPRPITSSKHVYKNKNLIWYF